MPVLPLRRPLHKALRFSLSFALCHKSLGTSCFMNTDLLQIKHIHYYLKLDVSKTNDIMRNDSDLVES